MLKILLVIIIFLIVFFLAVVLLLKFAPSVGKLPDEKKRAEYKARTEYFDGESFRNMDSELTVLAGGEDTVGKRRTPSDEIPVVKSETVESGEEGKLFVTWLGHSSALVQLGTENILIDPVFSKRVSPVQFLGPKRFSEVPVEYENLPEIDVMLISHDHYDHLDYRTIKALDGKVKKYIVPLGVESCLEGWGISLEKITALAWYETAEADGIEFTATPSQHFTMRNPFHRNAGWWCGFYFKDAYHSVYFTGDGGYSSNFKELAEKAGNIDLCLLECGQYGKGWPFIHMFPEESAQAALDCGVQWTIPVHWGAYCICNNDWDDSIIRFTAAADEKGIQYATPLIGERVDYDTISDFNARWWENIN